MNADKYDAPSSFDDSPEGRKEVTVCTCTFCPVAHIMRTTMTLLPLSLFFPVSYRKLKIIASVYVLINDNFSSPQQNLYETLRVQ